MKLSEFIKSTPVSVAASQKQHLHNIIEDAWQRKLLEEKYNYYNHYSNKKLEDYRLQITKYY